MKTSIGILSAGVACMLSSCDKPTSGQNTTEYRDGNSGATPSTVENETKVDSTKDREEKKR